MKWQGREHSNNIEDIRSYFGSDAIDPDYSEEDRFRDFLIQSLTNQIPQLPQKLEVGDPQYLMEYLDMIDPQVVPIVDHSSIEELLQDL